MKKIKTILDVYEVERLIYNDLDVMGAYPDYLSDDDEKRKLKKRLKELLVEGEEVLEEIALGYVMTTLGRVITGKRIPVLSMAASSKDIFVFVNAKRYGLREMLPNYNHKQTLKRLKEIGTPIKRYGYQE